MSRPKRAKDRRWFWGKIPADVVRLAAAPLGAAVAGLGPILFPGAPGGRLALVAIGLILALIGILVTLRNDAFLDGEHDLEVADVAKTHTEAKHEGTRRLAGSMREMIGAMSRTIGEGDASSTTHFVDQCAGAALSLLRDYDPEVSACIYKLDRREDDDDVPADDWSLRIVGERHGGFHVAREEFRYDSEEGRYVIERLRQGKTIRFPNLSEHAPPGHDPERPYAGFLSLPVNFQGKLRGMMSIDSQLPGVLTKEHERALMMVASFVGIGLTLIRDSRAPEPPSLEAVRRAVAEEGETHA